MLNGLFTQYTFREIILRSRFRVINYIKNQKLDVIVYSISSIDNVISN